jgi:RNA polymerase sigma-70 factor (ECF subfamily)
MPVSSAQSQINPQHTSETLVELLSSVANRDREAFAALYQATSLKLFGVVLRILKRKALAEDILQDVYIKIWEHAGDFNASRGSVIAWMAAIARNRALDEVRRGPHLVSSEDVPGFDDIASDEPHALDRISRSEDYNRLKHCLDGIEDQKRSMVLLAYHDGLSREVLAQHFGQPVATIKTWLRRSLQSLKECLGS